MSRRALIPVILVTLALATVLSVVHCAGVGDDEMPITTSSSEALEAYNTGLELAGNLRRVQALPYFEKAIKLDPNFAMAHLNLALVAPDAKGFFENMDRADDLAKDATEGERLFIKAWVAGAEGEPVRRRELLQKLIEMYPEDRQIRMAFATHYFTQQEYELAIAEYEKIVTRWPDFAPPYNMLGYCYRSVGNYDAAGKAFDKYIELIPDDPNPYDSYAELLTRAGKYEKAIEYYRKALDIEPSFNPSHLGIAHDLMFLGRHDEALTELDRAYEDARDHGQARAILNTRVVVLVDQGDLARALEVVDEILAHDARVGDSTAMSNALGTKSNLFVMMGEYDQAEATLERSLAVLEASEAFERIKRQARLDYQYGLGRILLARGDLTAARQKAEAYFTEIESLQKPFRLRNAHMLLGRIALAEGDYQTAIDEILQANQEDAWTRYHLGRAYEGNGQLAEALAAYRQAAETRQFNNLFYSRIRAEAEAKVEQLTAQLAS